MVVVVTGEEGGGDEVVVEEREEEKEESTRRSRSDCAEARAAVRIRAVRMLQWVCSVFWRRSGEEKDGNQGNRGKLFGRCHSLLK